MVISIPNAEKTDFARRPGLLSSPFYDVEESFARASRHGIKDSRRLPQASFIGPDHCVTMLGPEGRIWSFPGCMRPAMIGIDFGKRFWMEAICSSISVGSRRQISRRFVKERTA